MILAEEHIQEGKVFSIPLVMHYFALFPSPSFPLSFPLLFWFVFFLSLSQFISFLLSWLPNSSLSLSLSTRSKMYDIAHLFSTLSFFLLSLSLSSMDVTFAIFFFVGNTLPPHSPVYDAFFLPVSFFLTHSLSPTHSVPLSLSLSILPFHQMENRGG